MEDNLLVKEILIQEFRELNIELNQPLSRENLFYSLD